MRGWFRALALTIVSNVIAALDAPEKCADWTGTWASGNYNAYAIAVPSAQVTLYKNCNLTLTIEKQTGCRLEGSQAWQAASGAHGTSAIAGLIISSSKATLLEIPSDNAPAALTSTIRVVRQRDTLEWSYVGRSKDGSFFDLFDTTLDLVPSPLLPSPKPSSAPAAAPAQRTAAAAAKQPAAADSAATPPPALRPSITFAIIVAGGIEDFDSHSIRMKLASLLDGVTPPDISLHVSAASVRVTVTINVATATDADADVAKLLELAASPEKLSAALGVTVEEMADAPHRVEPASSTSSALGTGTNEENKEGGVALAGPLTALVGAAGVVAALLYMHYRMDGPETGGGGAGVGDDTSGDSSGPAPPPRDASVDADGRYDDLLLRKN